jgi:glycerol-3-phosphate dehydrogenase (NAD(P)+)
LPDHPVGVLSGPGFAADIAKGLPTAMAIAAADMQVAERLAQAISGRTFRLYASADRIGVQLGGALKNVLAIACGIVEGAGIGDSARAALIARGLAEMSRFIVAKGGNADTARGLSGLGDLVLTATSHQSRNLRFGIALGRGEKVDPSHGELVEGAFAAAVASRLAEELGVEMPITDAVSAIIDGRLGIPEAIEQLMTRPITTE